jgi:hypothetical protein
MDRDHRLHVGAGAGEIDDIAAAETIAKCGAALGVADAARGGLFGHDIETGNDAPPGLRHVVHQRLEELHRVLVALGAFAFAEHVDHEGNVLAAGERLGALDHVLGDAQPIGRDQKQRSLRLDALVVDQFAPAPETRHRILDRFNLHVTLLLHHLGRRKSKSQPRSAPRISCA